MGMSASQARLLTITARLHDVEFKAQAIQNAKIQLATQSDQVYRDYIAALDDTTLTIKNSTGEKVQANFNNIRGLKAVDTGKTYALRASNGQLIVSDDERLGYERFKELHGSSPQDFALFMLIGDDGNSRDTERLKKIEEEVFAENESNAKLDDKSMRHLKEQMDDMLAEKEYKDFSREEQEKFDKLKNSYDQKLYKNYGSQIFTRYTGEEEENYNSEEFNYYVNLYKQIEANGGCVNIGKFDGPDGDAANNSDWLENMINCGKITMYIVTEKDGEMFFNGTSTASDTYIGTTTTTEIDKSKLAKVEAKYEHDTKEINIKDKKYDLELSKLETERSALTKQVDSLKTVIKDNVDRTFGIFS